MSFRQKTFTHTMDNNLSIGRGQLTGGAMYSGQAPTTDDSLHRQPSKPTLSQMKGMEQDQHIDDVIGGNASPYGW